MEVVRDLWSGKRRFADVRHPDLAIVQDIAVQAGQGRIEDRAQRVCLADPTPASSCGAASSRANCAPSPKAARPRLDAPPADIVPTLGF